MAGARLSFLSLMLVACAAGPEGVAPSTASAPVPPAGGAGGPAVPAGEAASGTVHAGGADVWHVIPDTAPGTRYCLDGALATAAVKVEGQRVRFAGAAGEIPPNVRLACTPYTYSLLAPTAP